MRTTISCMHTRPQNMAPQTPKGSSLTSAFQFPHTKLKNHFIFTFFFFKFSFICFYLIYTDFCYLLLMCEVHKVFSLFVGVQILKKCCDVSAKRLIKFLSYIWGSQCSVKRWFKRQECALREQKVDECFFSSIFQLRISTIDCSSVRDLGTLIGIWDEVIQQKGIINI